MVSITREFIDSALVEFLGIIVQFRFCVLLYGNGTLKSNSYVSMLEEVYFPYFWALVGDGCPFFVFIFFVVLILVGVFFFVASVVLDPVIFLPESYCFLRLFVLHSILFVFVPLLVEADTLW